MHQESIMNTAVIPRRALLVAMLAVGASCPALSFAQSWETAGGFINKSELFRGTLAMRNCSPSGEVLSVGTATPGGANPNTNLLIQRLSSVGSVLAPGFQAEYDTGQQPEQGARAVEYNNGGGFAVVGSLDQTPTNPTSRLVVTKFDCNGTPQWRFSYGYDNGLNLGADILQAGYSGGGTTQAGDLVVLGNFQPTASSVRMPRIVRLQQNNTGPYLWGYDYPLTQPSGGTWTMAALAEIGPGTGTTQTRIVAVGTHGNFAAAMVVDGGTGTPLCAVRVDGLQRASFHDVVAYGNGFIAVGQTSTSTTSAQMYLARFDANCALQTHTHWGANNDVEIARAVDLTLSNTHGGAPAGVLMVGGEVNGAYVANPLSQDGYLTLADPQTLLSYTLSNNMPATGQRYGTAFPGAEKIYSVSAAANGAYLAGSTSSPWPTSSSDPMDAYTVRALDIGFKTACSVDWKMPATKLVPVQTTLSAATKPIPWRDESLPVRLPDYQLDICCTLWYGPNP